MKTKLICAAILTMALIGCSAGEEESAPEETTAPVSETEVVEAAESEASEVAPEPECIWRVTEERFLHKAYKVEQLGANYLERTGEFMPGITIEQLLQTLGRPCFSKTLKCENCAESQNLWIYEIEESSREGARIVRRLTYTLNKSGICTRFEQSIRAR